MKKFILPVAALALLAGCAGNGQKTVETEAVEDEVTTEEVAPALDGAWRLADYAGEAEVQIVGEGDDYLLTFDPMTGTFGMSTDCNGLGGQYKVVGDSLLFDNIAATQMACPSEVVENAMKTILPMITTYAVFNDSILQLRADARTMATLTRVAE